MFAQTVFENDPNDFTRPQVSRVDRYIGSDSYHIYRHDAEGGEELLGQFHQHPDTTERLAYLFRVSGFLESTNPRVANFRFDDRRGARFRVALFAQVARDRLNKVPPRSSYFFASYNGSIAYADGDPDIFAVPALRREDFLQWGPDEEQPFFFYLGPHDQVWPGLAPQTLAENEAFWENCMVALDYYDETGETFPNTIDWRT
jgi:hypothetical protein